MKNDKLIIIGAGGHGKVVLDIAKKLGHWKYINFLDDNEKLKIVSGINVLGKTSDASKYVSTHDIFVAIGNNTVRERFFVLIDKMLSLIHI